MKLKDGVVSCEVHDVDNGCVEVVRDDVVCMDVVVGARVASAYVGVGFCV